MYYGPISDPMLIEATLLPIDMRTNRILRRHPSQWIALLALVVTGMMSFITSSNAGGGAAVDIGITLEKGLGNEPVWVCLLYTSPSPRDRG